MRNAILRNHLKVIPLKLFYYQTFFETLRNEQIGLPLRGRPILLSGMITDWIGLHSVLLPLLIFDIVVKKQNKSNVV